MTTITSTNTAGQKKDIKKNSGSQSGKQPSGASPYFIPQELIHQKDPQKGAPNPGKNFFCYRNR